MKHMTELDPVLYGAEGDKVVNVRLTKSQCRNVADFLEFGLIDYIRNDPDLDNVRWVADMVDAFRILEKAGGENAD